MPLPLKDAYDRRVLMFQDHFSSASAAPSTDAIHEMRVALKRLRTFFNLVEALDPGFKAEEAFAGARKLFRAAGRVRNVQILEAEAYRSAKAAGLEISEFYNWLKEAERKAVRRFSRACGAFRSDFFDSAWKRMSVLSAEGLTGRRLRKGLESRLLTLLREMRRAAAGRRNGRRLHALRTRAKEARYTLEILEECGLTGEEGARLNEHLRDVHQALGRWHDEAVVLGSVREFRSGREPAPLFSPKSYLEFGRLARVRQAEDLDSFEAAWAALLAFLGRGTGRRVFRSALSGPRAALGPEGELAAGG
jgi:CHAD domain-containing protein